jgi:hypothetical protein
MPGKHLSKAKLKKAITNSGGIIAMICKRSGYTWMAVRDFIRDDPELAAMVKNEEETIDDMAESTVINEIKNGNEATARWWLARRRRVKFGDSMDITAKIEGVVTVDWDEKNANND